MAKVPETTRWTCPGCKRRFRLRADQTPPKRCFECRRADVEPDEVEIPDGGFELPPGFDLDEGLREAIADDKSVESLPNVFTGQKAPETPGELAIHAAKGIATEAVEALKPAAKAAGKLALTVAPAAGEMLIGLMLIGLAGLGIFVIIAVVASIYSSSIHAGNGAVLVIGFLSTSFLLYRIYAVLVVILREMMKHTDGDSQK